MLGQVGLIGVRDAAKNDRTQADRVDNERIVFPMSDRTAISLRKQIRRMLVIQENAPDLLMKLHQNRDLARCLNDLHRIVRAAKTAVKRCETLMGPSIYMSASHSGACAQSAS